jgi:hypothetical protein
MHDKPIAAGKSSFSLIDEGALFAELALDKDAFFWTTSAGGLTAQTARSIL